MTKVNRYACPNCGLDMEDIFFRSISTSSGDRDIYVDCPYCENKIVILVYGREGRVVLNEREGAENV